MDVCFCNVDEQQKSQAEIPPQGTDSSGFYLTDHGHGLAHTGYC